jgi:hypothetical protein
VSTSSLNRRYEGQLRCGRELQLKDKVDCVNNLTDRITGVQSNLYSYPYWSCVDQFALRKLRCEFRQQQHGLA